MVILDHWGTIMPEPVIYQFNHATVIYKEEFSAATGKIMPSLHVQIIDQYRYQREFNVEYCHESGNTINKKNPSQNCYWQYCIYKHPGRRYVDRIQPKVAKQFIERFLHLCKEYPTLLFNKENDRLARHDGFVHMAELLHDGMSLSIKIL